MPRSNRPREHLITAILWSAPAERSGDGALAYPARSPDTKAVSRFACHRTPHVRTTKVSVAVSRCTLSTLIPTELVGHLTLTPTLDTSLPLNRACLSHFRE